MKSERVLEAHELMALYGAYDAAHTTAEMTTAFMGGGSAAAEKWQKDAANQLDAAISDEDALRINVFLASSLLADRFAIVRRLREQEPPVSWSRIGAVLGMSKQAANEWFLNGNIRPRAVNPTKPSV